MERLSFQPDDIEIEKVVTTYSNMLFKLCFVILKNSHDSEDAVSEVFMKYITGSHEFKNEEHKKAWLIKVSVNVCKDILKYNNKRRHLNKNISSGKLIIKTLLGHKKADQPLVINGNWVCDLKN